MDQTGRQISNHTRRSVVAGGLGAAIAGCSVPQVGGRAAVSGPGTIDQFGMLKPLDLNTSNLAKITVCLRPFRPAGPRLETERVGEKSIVHNYGHGGSGWSLAWGYAEATRDIVLALRPRNVSVVGAGAIGLTSAIAIAETGARVTIYAREMPMDSASAKATGVWSPASRIGMQGVVPSSFAAQWEVFARRSHARHLQYVGRAGSPVEYTPRFYIRTGAPEPTLADAPEGSPNFMRLGRNLRGLEPPWTERDAHPFPADFGVRGGMVMTFNIAEYTRQLVEDFRAMGGRIVQAEFGTQEELTQVPGNVIVNCSGIGARSLTGDDTLTPVRGQIAWMPAQSDRLYGIYHRGVMALSRRDGLLIQETGGSDFYGYRDDDQSPSQEEFLAAQAKVAPMFAW